MNELKDIRLIVKIFQNKLVLLVSKLEKIERGDNLFGDFVNIFMANLIGVENLLNKDLDENSLMEIKELIKINSDFFIQFEKDLKKFNPSLADDFLKVYNEFIPLVNNFIFLKSENL